jgi:hypothetical protein
MDKKITKIAAIIIGTIVAVVILVMGYRLMAGVLIGRPTLNRGT